MVWNKKARQNRDGEYLVECEGDAQHLPYLSLDDAFKLDDVREALRRGDVKTASRRARLFTLNPVAV